MKTSLKVVPLLVGVLLIASAAIPLPLQAGDNPNPPEEIVKLIFIHHSTGENWLSDGYGNLGQTLDQNNYFVSDTNYGWGPEHPSFGFSSQPDENPICVGLHRY